MSSKTGIACVLALMLNFGSSYPDCDAGITCYTITPSDKPDMTFDCSYVEGSGEGSVYLMHGNDGLKSKGMFFETMRQLGTLGYSSLACDARGYSPGAAPDEYSAYNYDELQGDIFSIVDASGLSTPFGGQFHLVSHDQGARISWHAIAFGSGRQRFLSLTSLSIPHADVFSDSLVSDHPDADQQEASQYVRELVLPNSTTFDGGSIWRNVCQGEGFATPEDCQKTLWWYNGAIDAGSMALPPMMDYAPGSVAAWLGIPQADVEAATQYSLDGVPQTVKVGNVTEFPVLYACGGQDTSDLCKQEFSDQSSELIANYTYLRVDSCGHDVLGCASAQLFIDQIILNIQSAGAASGEN